MKLLILAAIGLTSFSAFAKKTSEPPPKEFRIYEHIEFQKETYYDDLNLMDDGVEIADGYTWVGYGARFKVAQGEQYTISSQFITDSDMKADCPYSNLVVTPLENNQSLVSVDFNADAVEIDSGDKCQYTIETSTGHKAVISIFSEGT